jgi:hypothetical protein
LPELGRTIAKAVTEFRRAQSDLKATFEREMQAIERENESLKEVTRTAAIDISGFSEIDLSGSSTGTYGSGSAPEHPALAAPPAPDDSTQTHTEPTSQAEQEAILASLMNPPAAATEPGVNYGQPEPAVESTQPEATVGVPGTVPRTESATAGHLSDNTAHVPASDTTATEAARQT